MRSVHSVRFSRADPNSWSTSSVSRTTAVVGRISRWPSQQAVHASRHALLHASSAEPGVAELHLAEPQFVSSVLDCRTQVVGVDGARWLHYVLLADPHQTALDFASSAVTYACAACDWDPTLAASAQGIPPPVV